MKRSNLAPAVFGQRVPRPLKNIAVMVLTITAVFRLVACTSDPSEPTPDPSEPTPDPVAGFETPAMLQSLAEQVILPTYQDFQQAAASLLTGATSWNDQTPASAEWTTSRSQLQDDWRTAMTAWQEAEAMLLGPAGSSLSTIGGLDLRDEIYSWPTVNPCRVDQRIADEQYADSNFFNINLVNAYGLDAMEYLLFSSGTDNACSGLASINSDGSWAALSEDSINTRRAEYVLVLATELVRRADELVALWDPSDGNFVEKLATAGQEGSPYPDEQAAITAVFHAMFYLETSVKDAKLATPLGIIGCNEATCPEALESLHADYALESVRANLVGFKKLLEGGQAEGSLGFADLLIFAEHPELATDLLTNVDNTLAVIDGMDATAQAAIESNPDSLLAVHTSLKTVTDLLKVEVAMALFLELPQEAANDND
ncbi:MAG: hypothetical protein CMP23_08395 [Rickettsiales bacterium]|nr:hypothetical protein [Rickettsiales bacterium]|tara:strand:- start:1662 stop:2945 length:1284 start_codon:yes stop_codon:yes gene_type:complete